MKTYLLPVLGSIILAVGFLLPHDAQAQIQEVKQTVFGMDCAPCAHGLQKRLGRIEGVTDVKVSLDEGMAVLQFETANRASLEAIREGVEASGFAAKDATIRVAGMLRDEGGEMILIAGSGDRYVLVEGEKAAFARLKDAAGKQVVVTGVVPEGAPQEAWRLRVLEARA